MADCQAALKIKTDYEKAMIRAAHCCQLLGKYDECVIYCNDILMKDPFNEDVVKLRNEASIKKVRKEITYFFIKCILPK